MNHDPFGSDEAETGGFLARWSRRKQAAMTGEAAPEQRIEPSSDDRPGPAPPATAAAGDDLADLTEAEAEDGDEPLELPSLDQIGPDFDLAPWLTRNVPEAWKLAALRRAWSADPAIRDFKGLADYDLDYNTPGAAPGYGPLTESDDVKAMVRRIFGEPDPEESSLTASTSGASSPSEQESSGPPPPEGIPVAAQQETPVGPHELAPPLESPLEAKADADAATPKISQLETVNRAEPVRKPPRRGGAMPV